MYKTKQVCRNRISKCLNRSREKKEENVALPS